MKRKIIGVTVGSPLPKPNLMQNDPTKGDYVKGKEEFLEQINIPGSGGNVENGEDGFSPIATVTQTDSGAVISITDKTGTTTATITNGKDGKDGADGQPGKDGADGKDYVLTDADKSEIMAMVIESLGGNPVFGYVDEDNNIIVSGNLPDGTYSVKYEMENGTTVNIGNLVLDTNVYYTVTNNLTQCTTNNSATKAVQGESYAATITATSGYELKSLTVTMGGNPVTVSGGNISIAIVTGDIVITAVAEEIKANYTNLFKLNEATINNRLNSSAAVTPQDGYFITNIIDVSDKTPFTANTKIYVKSAILNDDGKSRIFTYSNTGTEYTGVQSSVQTKNMTITDEGNGVLSMSGLEASFGSGTKRFVMCLKVSDTAITESDIQNFVITIDEPIV